MKIGTNDIANCKIGNNQVSKVYLGTNLVWNSFTGLLDAYPNAAAAFSLRRLRTAYTGSAIRVRRADNTEQDIGFVNNELDTVSLLSFVGSGDGFVTVIYDQSGSNNMVQATANLQGKIANSGSIINLNDKPCIERSANDDGGYLSAYAPNDGATVKGVYYVGYNNGNKSAILGSNTGGGDQFYLAQSGNSAASLGAGGKVTVTNSKVNNQTISSTITRGEMFTKTDNQFLLSVNANYNFDNNVIGLGFKSSNPVGFGMYTFQELVIFENTTDYSEKQTEINNFYSIY